MTAPNSMSRRRMLGAGLAATVAAPLLGCATAGGPSLGRVVVVGGGYGGATAAHYLRLWGNVNVTLVERNPTFISCPLSNLVLGGHKTMADITVPYGGLDAFGIQRIQAEVASIDPQAQQVRLADGRTLPYDRLIVSPGVDFLFDQIGGLDAAAQDTILHAWKAGPQTVALRKQLEAMPDGGVYALAMPRSPYRCPPGPYERAALVASYFKQHKPRSKVLLLDANPEIQSKKALFEKVYANLYGGIVEYRPNSVLKSVDAATRTAKLELEDVKADVLNVVPAHRGAEIARRTGLLNMPGGWAGVNWLTMESTAVPGIHVLGDAVLSAPAMPKSGHMANQHAKVAAAAVIQLLKGEPVNPDPVVMNTCYSFVSATDVIHVASVHQYDKAGKTFKAMPGGGVSSAPSEAEGRYAMSWAQNIWADMLGTPPAA